MAMALKTRPVSRALALSLAILTTWLPDRVSAIQVERTQKYSEEAGNNRAITQVVKLLQDMLEKSKDDGNSEQKLYAKFKCYYDTTKAEKEKEIEDRTQEISLLESSIDGLQASSGMLSTDVAGLDADMTENQNSQTEAAAIRDKDQVAFASEEADLSQAIEQMTQAIKTLSAVGADQNMGASAEHTKYMSDFKGAASAALLAAKSMMTEKQVVVVDSFLQAPFTGTYSAQSGMVVGILQDMLDTFTTNLAEARDKEAKAVKAHKAYMEDMAAALQTMQASFEMKQASLSTNDGELADKTTQLDIAKDAKAMAEEFLESLEKQFAEKKTQYEQRTSLRMSEEAAIAEAVSILNSDAAFETFGKVSATSSGSTGGRFLQLRRVRHRGRARETPRSRAQEVLQRSVGGTDGRPSTLLGRVAAMLQANNPFKTVLDEIEKMISLLAEDEQADKTQHAWCAEENDKTSKSIRAAKTEIETHTGTIETLTETIEHPETGLLIQIEQHERDMEENQKAQTEVTEDRKEDNERYQTEVKHLVEAQALLKRAVTVLEKFYSSIALPQVAGRGKASGLHSQTPPETWEDTYKGQDGGGAIGMLKFIAGETKKEEDVAHADEQAMQTDFETVMQMFTEQEKELVKSTAELKKALADSEEQREDARRDLNVTQVRKADLEAYQLKIKPGCDFINAHLDDRQASRSDEKKSLTDAAALLRGTPAYQEAMAVAHNETLGDCKDICAKNEDLVDCKACLAKTSIPGFCAGHPSTEGCNN